MARSTRQTVFGQISGFFPELPCESLHFHIKNDTNYKAPCHFPVHLKIDGNQQTLRHNGDKQYQILPKPLRAVAMASGYRLSPGIPSDSSTCLQSGQRCTRQYDNITFFAFIHNILRSSQSPHPHHPPQSCGKMPSVPEPRKRWNWILNTSVSW